MKMILILLAIPFAALAQSAPVAPAIYSIAQNQDGSWTTFYTFTDGQGNASVREVDVNAGAAPTHDTAISVSFELALAQQAAQ